MSACKQEILDDGLDDGPGKSIMHGGWLNVLSPSIALLVTATGERLGIPGWLAALMILLTWFAGFFVLIRAQFARRHRNVDVFRAFWWTTVLGLTLVAVLLIAMYFIR